MRSFLTTETEIEHKSEREETNNSQAEQLAEELVEVLVGCNIYLQQ